MKKLFLTLLLSLFYANIFAQLDTEHWFAPMFDRNSSSNYYSNTSRQYLHLSTNETQAFDVEIYSNNTLIATARNLRKGNPQKVYINEQYIISKNFSEPGKVINKGLYVKGSKKFFANLRFSTYNHAEILTSKGTAGIGNKFYVITTPQYHSTDVINTMVGILATENNTKVKISGYHSDVRFTNINPTPQSIEITLNKGQSYILEGDAYSANKDGFIGAKIEANKPVSITNGNFNGQYTDTQYTNGSDIIMDQSVPVDRLGNEFAIIKGNGEIGRDMEGAIIVATEDNTQIYLNDETTPIITLNEGEYYIVPDTKFITPRRGHYNLYIKSTKNIYLYQLLGGVSTSTATAGFNYIPPLNCFLPTEIGEIGRINELDGEGQFGVYSTTNAKLNFITMKDAIVNVSGATLNSNHGPFPLSGSEDWVTYSIPNVSGNISITSTKPVTAGISAGNGYAGYGGYFAGFSSVITIKRNGECLPNLILEIEQDFDSYQWLKDGQPIAGATSKTYTPTQPGNYSVEVKNGYCTHTTAETRVVNCIVETTIDDNICGVKIYTPTFSQSNQQIDLSSITITKQPTKGNIKIENGTIIYTPNVSNGTDSFTYQFCGIDNEFPDCEIVSVNLNIGTLPINNAELKTCKINDEGIFDLTSANIGDTTDYVVKYYPTLADAQNETNAITNPSAYSSNEGQVFAKVSSNDGCHTIATIDLKFHDSPIINVANYNANHCDANFDGVVEINLSEVATAIAGENVSEIKFYATQNDAENGTNPLPENWSYSTDTTIFAKAISDTACSNIEAIHFTIKDRLNLLNNTHTAKICDDDFDGIINANLEDYLSIFTNNTSATATFYTNLADAQNATNPIDNQREIKNGERYFIRIESANYCANIAELTFEINTPKKSETLTDKVVCPNKTTILDAGAGFASYQWSNGATTQSITAGAGDYWVILTTADGCAYKQEVKVSEFDFAKLENATLKTCQENGVGIFDLTSANINNTDNYAVKYYPTLADAENGTNEITNPTAYSSKGGKVYAKAFSDAGCSAVVEISLEFHASPIINVNNYNATHCDNNFDGVVEINFAEVSVQIAPNYEVKYYLNEADAKAGNNNFLPNQWSYSTDTSVFVKAISNEGCHTIEQIDFKIKDRLALTQNQAEITLCDDDLDGIINVNLANYHSLITQENVIGSYYATLTDAQNATNPLSVINAKNGETYYLRLESSAHCANIASLKFNINTPKKSNVLTDQLICKDDTTILDAGAGFTSYLWSTGETTQNITAGVGTYWVKLTSDNGCSYTQYVNVNAIETPKIISIDIKENVVSVNAEGGTQPYEYSLDGGRWQTSNVFTNVREGRHRVAVRSQNGCSPTEQDFSIIKLNNLITPNGDGINDTIDYSDLRTKANAKFNIYDRYGALVFEGNNSNQFIWDGKAKGRPLPTATYWYEIEWQEPNTNTWVKTASWILLKNRD